MGLFHHNSNLQLPDIMWFWKTSTELPESIFFPILVRSH